MSNLTLTHGSINYEGLVQGIQTFLTCGFGQLRLGYTTNCHMLCCCYVPQYLNEIPRNTQNILSWHALRAPGAGPQPEKPRSRARKRLVLKPHV